MLRAHGFTTDQLVELVLSGIVGAMPTRGRAGCEVMEIATLRITDKGRKVLVAVKP